MIPTNLKLEDDAAIPAFNISFTHKCYVDPSQPNVDPFMSFPGHTKFFLLRRLGNMYLESFKEGRIAHTSVQENNLASSLVGIISLLTKFGFQSTYKKVPVIIFPWHRTVKLIKHSELAQRSVECSGPHFGWSVRRGFCEWLR